MAFLKEQKKVRCFIAGVPTLFQPVSYRYFKNDQVNVIRPCLNENNLWKHYCFFNVYWGNKHKMSRLLFFIQTLFIIYTGYLIELQGLTYKRDLF